MRTKRALVCAPLMPEYDRERGSARIFNHIEFLRDAQWSVSFVAQNMAGGQRYVRVLQRRGVATYAEDSRRTDALIANGRFDLALCNFWRTSARLAPTIRALSPETRIVLDTIDLHFVREARSVFRERSGGSPRLDTGYGTDMANEINASADADAVLTVSRKEKVLLGDLISDSERVYTVPDCDDFARSPLSFAERRGVLFVGNFRHPPNVDAVEYLCKEIVPKLSPMDLARHPIYVVGNDLRATVRGFGSRHAGVRMVGWVPSLQPYFERARVSVVPLRYGAGTKGKLIQALMVGTPSVVSSVAAEGLDLSDGEHVLIADDSRTFAHAIGRLLNDPILFTRLADRGRLHARARHARDTVKSCFLSALDDVLLRDPRPTTA